MTPEQRDNNNLIDSFYRWGSDGCVNLFYRPEGTLVLFEMNRELLSWTAPQDEYIIQWGGNPGFDSGYTSDHFETLTSAREIFEEMADEEYEQRSN
jgi:hypothetical protein